MLCKDLASSASLLEERRKNVSSVGAAGLKGQRSALFGANTFTFTAQMREKQGQG
jgi:hypothetical protein